MATIIVLFIFSYIIGSIPFSLLLGKWVYNIDIRKHGSGNVGTTNTFRILGKKAGIVVLLLDMLKGTLPVVIAYFIGVDVHIFLVGLVAALGHVYSIFLKFNGGKAVATSAGAVLGYNPILFLTLLAIFLICLKTSKYVSISSMIAALAFFISTLIIQDWLMIICGFITAVVIIGRHRSNIKRIIEGTESKITFM